MTKRVEMIGKTFGRLVVTEEAGRSKKMEVLWRCVCECGNEIVAGGVNLRRGNTKSCGCLRNDTASAMFSKHRKSGTRLYGIWNNMIHRCYNPKASSFKFYGGRGIRVCERWEIVDNFYNDMEEEYVNHVRLYGEEDTTLDRIDVNGDYEPSNCRWATRCQQSRNQRTHSTNKSGVTGVSWSDRHEKWLARITLNNKTKYLGLFTDFDAAVDARKQSEVEFGFYGIQTKEEIRWG